MDKILLITDTSGKHGSVGLARASDTSPEIRVAESVPLAGGTFSAQLVPQIASLLERNSLSKKDLDGFVVVSGPGSFTGLRVGLAAVKGLAETLHKPIVPVSLLDVVARAAGGQGRVKALLDAGRGEVYLGEYDVSEDEARVTSEELQPLDDFLSSAGTILIATPDELLAQKARERNLTAQLVKIGTEEIARVGWLKMQAGEAVSPEQLEANYIRRSDAEIFAKPASSL